MRGSRSVPRRSSSGTGNFKGFTLIELLVSLAIGLLVTIATLSAYLSSSAASKMTDAQGRMNEDGQAALAILTLQLRMAGSNPDRPDRVDNTDPALSSRRNPVYSPSTFPTGTYTTSAFTIRGCDGRFTNIATATSLDNLICAAGTSTLPDSIAISYEADRFNTIPTTVATGSVPTDCLGKKLSVITAMLPTVIVGGTVSSTVSYSVSDNRFYLASSATGESPSLYCKGNGEAATPQALVENIEDIQLTYGTVSTTPTSATPTVAGYLRADQITALAAAANDPEPWRKVLSVRICVLVHSEKPVVSDLASARYLGCDGTLNTAPPDLRLRRTYATTVVMRNRRL